uniref:RanBD1 domain-containing protein n=1 Tax=Ciona savignyi TaxID=51511 RepID=H2Z0B7_CIOSA
MAAAGSTQKPKEFESEKVIVENCEKETVFFKGGDDGDDDDVIFVWEAVPTKRQLELATELKLPPTFFMYQDDPNLEDTNSDEEDGILEYIRLRDDPENHISDAEYSANARCDTSTSEPEESSICKEESQVESTENKLEGGNLFAGFGATSTYSFSSMAATANNNNAFGVRKDAAFTVTAQQSMLFSGASEDTDAEAYDPEYKPVLAQPPPLIEVKTGEEDEEVLFKERSKMYRFDSSTNAWKERGLGEIKILHHPVMNIYRVVMRREQVLKVCANHLITPDMKLMPNTDKAWMYVAQNKSDGDAVLEKLTVKFKTPQISMQFKSIWEDCQSKMKS